MVSTLVSPVDADCFVTSLPSLVHVNVTLDDTDDVHVKLTDERTGTSLS